VKKKEYITNLYNMPTLCQPYANFIYLGKEYLEGLDLSTLVRKKLLNKNGEKKGVYYTLK